MIDGSTHTNIWDEFSSCQGRVNFVMLLLTYYMNFIVCLISVPKLHIYCKVARSRPVYYSILNSLGHRSQDIRSNFPFINSLMILKCATNRENLLLATLQYLFVIIFGSYSTYCSIGFLTILAVPTALWVLWMMRAVNKFGRKWFSFFLPWILNGTS